MSDPPDWAYSWGRGVTERIDARDFPPEVLALVEEAQGGRFCTACGPAVTLPPGEPLELDHKQPLAAGGDNNYLNLRWLCRSHNRGRGARKRPPATPAWARREARRGT